MSYIAISLEIILLIILLHLLAAYGGYRLIQRRPPVSADNPANHGLPYEAVHFPSLYKAMLEGWWIPAQEAKGTLILCHGQNGSMEGDLPQAIPLHQAGYNVFMFNFRAHGKSEGKHVTFGVFEKEDLLGAIEFLHQSKGIEQVAVMGFSMGAGVALITAALTDRVSVLILDGIFLKFRIVVQRAFRERFIPPFHFLAAELSIIGAMVITNTRMYQVSPLLWTKHLEPRVPVLFIHSECDQYATLPEIQQVMADLKSPHELWIAAGSHHRKAFEDHPEEYNRRVLAWLETHYHPNRPL